MNHEPEDLLGELTIVPSRAREQARMKKRVQSSGSFSGLEDFFIWTRVDNIFPSSWHGCWSRCRFLHWRLRRVSEETVLK